MFEYLFHYNWDYEENTPSYTRWITASDDEEALTKFYSERSKACNVWYEIYRWEEHLDGSRCLVLDM